MKRPSETQHKVARAHERQLGQLLDGRRITRIDRKGQTVSTMSEGDFRHFFADGCVALDLGHYAMAITVKAAATIEGAAQEDGLELKRHDLTEEWLARDN